MSENNALSYWEDFTVGDVQEFGNMLVTVRQRLAHLRDGDADHV